MTIDLKTVKHISKLSRISVTDEKAKKLAEDLTWEGYFTKLKLDQEEILRKQKENEKLLAEASNALYEQ